MSISNRNPADCVWYISIYSIYRMTFIRLLIWNKQTFTFFFLFKTNPLVRSIFFSQVSFLVCLWSKADMLRKGSCPKCKIKDKHIMNLKKNDRTLKKIKKQNNNSYRIMHFHLWTWMFAGVMGGAFSHCRLAVSKPHCVPTCIVASAFTCLQHTVDRKTTVWMNRLHDKP